MPDDIYHFGNHFMISDLDKEGRIICNPTECREILINRVKFCINHNKKQANKDVRNVINTIALKTGRSPDKTKFAVKLINILEGEEKTKILKDKGIQLIDEFRIKPALMWIKNPQMLSMFLLLLRTLITEGKVQEIKGNDVPYVISILKECIPRLNADNKSNLRKVLKYLEEILDKQDILFHNKVSRAYRKITHGSYLGIHSYLTLCSKDRTLTRRCKRHLLKKPWYKLIF